MSKANIRKKVSQMEQKKLVELVMDLYSFKDAKRYLESLFEPNFEKDLAEAKKKIDSEFAPTARSRRRFTVARKIVSDFKQLNPPEEMVVDLMLHLPETAASIANEYYVNPYSFNSSIASNLKVALKFIKEKGLVQQYKERVLELLEDMRNVAYGGYDEVWVAIDDICPEILEEDDKEE